MTDADSVAMSAGPQTGSTTATAWRTVLAGVTMLATALIVGFISLQIDGLTSGYLIGLSGTPVAVVGKRYPWELQIAEFILAAVFLWAYLVFFRSRAPRLSMLAVLVCVILFGWSVSGTVLRHDPMPVVSLCLGYAGMSPFSLTIAAAIAVFPGWRSGRGSRSAGASSSGK